MSLFSLPYPVHSFQMPDSDASFLFCHSHVYINKWIAKKTKATRNAMILKVLNEMTKGKEVTVENLDSLKDIFNEQLDPAIDDNAVVITNQSGFNYLDKLKEEATEWLIQASKYRQIRAVINHK